VSIFQKKIREHQKLIEKTKRIFKLGHSEDMQIFEVRPIPDLIIVDFKRKEVISVECSFHNERLQKKPKYRKSDFKKVLFIKASRKHQNKKPNNIIEFSTMGTTIKIHGIVENLS